MSRFLGILMLILAVAGCADDNSPNSSPSDLLMIDDGVGASDANSAEDAGDNPEDESIDMEGGNDVDVTADNVDELMGDPVSDEDMKRLADWMTGVFDSKDMEGRVERDSAGSYTFIWADLKQTRIWPEQTDGYWFYVEQAEHGQAPYRTRIYHLSARDDTTYVVDNYKLPFGSTTYSDAFDDPSVFDGVEIQDAAVYNPDCNVAVKRKGDRYYGYNNRETCTVNVGSTLNLDSFSIIEEEQLTSHDRGYDASGTLALGPGNTGYTFIKRQNYAIE